MPCNYISATNVRTGTIKVFHNEEMSAGAIPALACLPYSRATEWLNASFVKIVVESSFDVAATYV